MSIPTDHIPTYDWCVACAQPVWHTLVTATNVETCDGCQRTEQVSPYYTERMIRNWLEGK